MLSSGEIDITLLIALLCASVMPGIDEDLMAAALGDDEITLVQVFGSLRGEPIGRSPLDSRWTMSDSTPSALFDGMILTLHDQAAFSSNWTSSTATTSQ